MAPPSPATPKYDAGAEFSQLPSILCSTQGEILGMERRQG
jgi:hypothetical protein